MMSAQERLDTVIGLYGGFDLAARRTGLAPEILVSLRDDPGKLTLPLAQRICEPADIRVTWLSSGSGRMHSVPTPAQIGTEHAGVAPLDTRDLADTPDLDLVRNWMDIPLRSPFSASAAENWVADMPRRDLEQMIGQLTRVRSVIDALQIEIFGYTDPLSGQVEDRRYCDVEIVFGLLRDLGVALRPVPSSSIGTI